MKRIFWDVLVDANTYRVFETSLGKESFFSLSDELKKGIPFGDKWTPLQVSLFEGEKGYKRLEKKKAVADFMDTDLLSVVSPRGREIIEPLVADQMEFLPFETPVGPYFALHVQYVDCLDKSRIEAKYFADGRVMRVIKYSFYWTRLDAVNIFRLPDLGLSRLFVSDEFKQVVEGNGLTGLLFYPVLLAEEQ